MWNMNGSAVIREVAAGPMNLRALEEYPHNAQIPGAPAVGLQSHDLSGAAPSAPNLTFISWATLKSQYLDALAGVSRKTENLERSVRGLLAQGVSRQTLLSWGIAAGYAEGYVRAALGRILRPPNRRRKKGAGPKTPPEALELLAYARERYAEKAIGFLYGAYRAGKPALQDDADYSPSNEAPVPNANPSTPDLTLDSLSPKTCCHLAKFSVPSVFPLLPLKESLSEARRRNPESQAVDPHHSGRRRSEARLASGTDPISVHEIGLEHRPCPGAAGRVKES